MKTKTVTFTYGTCRDAVLKVPAEDCSLMDIANLILESYLDHLFRPGCGLFSDEVAVSSIGQANFYAGALGGYETRLTPETFQSLKDVTDNPIARACGIVRRRNPGLSQSEVYEIASRNEALDENARAGLKFLAKASLKVGA